MTEAEWLAHDEPTPMLRQLGAAPSLRKRRLLVLACCCRLIDLLNNHHLRQALQVAESWIEGACVPTERKNARRAAHAAAQLASGMSLEEGLKLSDSAAWSVQRLLQRGPLDAEHVLFVLAEARLKDAGARAHLAKLPQEVADAKRVGAFKTEGRAQCDLLRDVIGNPFRPVAFDSAWRTSTAVSLARGMYESRDFGAMPILADALQDAGCDSEDVLDHCRDPKATHVRGCWVVDLVLGKQ
jgi:hypothetical protein